MIVLFNDSESLNLLINICIEAIYSEFLVCSVNLLKKQCKHNLKMATCGHCVRPFTAKQLKVTCSDCGRNYHGTCVRMSKADIDYLTSEGNVWRCEPCSTERRRSLKLKHRLQRET